MKDNLILSRAQFLWTKLSTAPALFVLNSFAVINALCLCSLAGSLANTNIPDTPERVARTSVLSRIQPHRKVRIEVRYMRSKHLGRPGSNFHRNENHRFQEP